MLSRAEWYAQAPHRWVRALLHVRRSEQRSKLRRQALGDCVVVLPSNQRGGLVVIDTVHADIPEAFERMELKGLGLVCLWLHGKLFRGDQFTLQLMVQRLRVLFRDETHDEGKLQEMQRTAHPVLLGVKNFT